MARFTTIQEAFAAYREKFGKYVPTENLMDMDLIEVVERCIREGKIAEEIYDMREEEVRRGEIVF